MLVVSNDYLDAIRSMSRSDRLIARLTFLDGEEMPESEILIDEGSTSISWECTTGDELELGSCIMAELNIAFRTDRPRYSFYGSKIELEYGVKTANETWESIPLGIYTVAEAESKNRIVKMVAYDNLLTLDTEYGGKVFNGTPYEILEAICDTCGAKLGTTKEELTSFPNSSELIQIDETSDCKTYRDCVKVVAQMLGAFVVADRTGLISVRKYGIEPATTIPRRNRFSTTFADYECSYSGIRVISASDEYRVFDETRENGLELTMTNAPAWDYGVKETLQARVNAIFDELLKIRYTPVTASIAGDPTIECGDLISMETDSGVVNSLVTSITWKFHGKMSIKSSGANPLIQNQGTKKTAAIRNLEKHTSENRIIFYSFTNNEPVSVSDDKKELLSQVRFVTIKSTSALFIAQLPITVSCEDTEVVRTTVTEKPVSIKNASGVATDILDANGKPLKLTFTDTSTVKEIQHGYVDLEIEYYIDGVYVGYELIHRCRNGKSLLALSYAFTDLQANKALSWSVWIKVVGGNGTVSVAKRAFRATITGQGLAGTDRWDGTLNFMESVFLPIETVTMKKLYEKANVEATAPEPAMFTQVIPDFSIQSMGFDTGSLDIRFSASSIKVQNTFTWNYHDRYVETNKLGMMFRKEWKYGSEEAEIERGKMLSVKTKTDDLSGVDSITITKRR